MIKRYFAAFAVIAIVANSAFAQSRTRDGVAAGGVAGAIIGGIIGHQNDETPEGALIGGAVGAITGGLIGRAQDNELQRQSYQQQQTYYQQQQQYYSQQQAIAYTGMGIADVISMSRSGVSESLIISQLHAKGVQRRLEVSEIIALHQQGVSDTIIASMQQAPLATQIAMPRQQQQVIVQQPVVQRSVIVQEPVIYRQPVIYQQYYRPYPAYHHPHHHNSYGTSVHMRF